MSTSKRAHTPRNFSKEQTIKRTEARGSYCILYVTDNKIGMDIDGLVSEFTSFSNPSWPESAKAFLDMDKVTTSSSETLPFFHLLFVPGCLNTT